MSNHNLDRIAIAASLAALLLPIACGEPFETGPSSAATSGASDGGSGAATTAGTGGNGATGATGDAGGAPGCTEGTTCVAAAPDGWLGPVRFYAGTASPPDCPADLPLPIDAHAGTISADWSCEPCSCGAPAGQTCSAPTLALHNTYDCSGAQTGSITLPSDGSCVGGFSAASAKVGPSTPQGGACAPAGGSVTGIQDVGWELQVRLCSTDVPLDACGSGTCLADAPAPFAPGSCVYLEGDAVDCPAAFPSQTIVYREAIDDRGCSSCSCGAPSASSCEHVAAAYFNTASCGNAVGSDVGSCIPGSPTVGNLKWAELTGAAAGGTCAPAGGAPTGGVAGDAPLTVCCSAVP